MNEKYTAGGDIEAFASTAMKFLSTWSVVVQVLLAISFLFFGAWRSKAQAFKIFSAREGMQLEKGAPVPLEVRMTAPPRWENGCLSVTLERNNHTAVPVFLTEMGPYFYIALDVSMNEASTGEAIKWVNVSGVSDFRSLEAVSLAPGATLRNEFCLSNTIWVVNLQKKTRREIPVQGKLRIDVSYFPTEESWKINKEWYTDPPSYLKRDGALAGPPANIAPKWVKIFAAIPCSDAACESGCVEPPIGLPGEDRLVPDVYFLGPGWNDRGKSITDELAHKSAPCLKENSDLR